MIKLSYQMSFTKQELEHLGNLLSDNLREGSYYGNKKHWRARGMNLVGRILYALKDGPEQTANSERAA